MRIYVVDAWGKHWDEGVACLEAMGHKVTVGKYPEAEQIDASGLVIFHPVENGLVRASKSHERNRETVVIAEAVDIDIYAGHLGGVNWEYVDHLVFMAQHMREYAEARHRLPAGLPRSVIPGGVDLERWTLRPEREPAFNVAWIGRMWVAKNVFAALQIFTELVKRDPEWPWHLHLRGGEERWTPDWWERHCRYFMEQVPELAGRVEIVPHVADLDRWLDGMDFLLQTSYKEAFGYVVAQAAAKGIRPVIQMTTGSNEIWPREWVFATHAEAVEMLLAPYEPSEVRSVIKARYPIERRIERFLEIYERELGNR